MLHHSNVYNMYATRHLCNDMLYVPKANNALFKQSFQHTGPSFYNNLPKDVKDSTNLSCFKNRLRSHVMKT